MSEVASSPKHHICTLCDVSSYRLVLWNTPNFLCVEDADESSNEVICHLDSFFRLLVSIDDLMPSKI